MTTEFDYLVVGGSAAGAVAARRLAERTDGTVALLEAGPDAVEHPAVRDFRRYRELREMALARLYPHAAPPGAEPDFHYPVSRMLGGSTSQNTCIWFRPP